jgi:NADPH-dependent ferric siderophore reductase
MHHAGQPAAQHARVGRATRGCTVIGPKGALSLQMQHENDHDVLATDCTAAGAAAARDGQRRTAGGSAMARLAASIL